MSTEEASGPGRNLQDWADDFDALLYEPTGTAKGCVLNTAEEPPTMYQVNILEQSCDCPYGEEGPTDATVCKHLAKAMLAHPSFETREELLLRDLTVIVDQAHEASQRIADAAEGADEALVRMREGQAEQPAEEPDDDRGVDDVAKVREWLEANGVPLDDVDVWEHDQFGSIQIKANGMDQEDFDTFRDVMQAEDAINWDREQSLNFIKEDKVEEVVG